MTIEIISKPKSKKNILSLIFLIVWAVLFLFLLSSYFFLEFSSKKISQEIEKNKLLLTRTPAQKELEEKVLNYEAKINAFAEIFSSHQKVLAIFELVQKSVHPQVWFSNFSFNTSQAAVKVSGEAENFIVLEQQLIILKKMDLFKKVSLSQISTGEKKISFSLDLKVDPEIFK